MNERITQLALEASDPKTGWLDRKKFAELIVRECAFVAQNKDDNNIDLRYGRSVAAGKIREHFGVEE